MGNDGRNATGSYGDATIGGIDAGGATDRREDDEGKDSGHGDGAGEESGHGDGAGEESGHGPGVGKDEDRTWRCRACGALQRDPEPPCHRCWNTTFVAGAGANDVTGSSGTFAGVSTDPVSEADVAAARVENVKAATTRTAFAGVLGTGLLSVTTLLLPEGGVLHSLSATAEFGVGVVSVALLAFTALVYVGAFVVDWR